MTQDSQEKHQKWIEGFLVPHLIENNKIINCQNPIEHIALEFVVVSEMQKETAFMMSHCYLVKVSVAISDAHNQCKDSGKNDNKNNRLFHFFVKISLSDEPETYDKFGLQHLFSNEINGYEHIVPRLDTLAKCPKYYYSHNEPMNAAIVLSDFTSDGWKMSQSLGNLSIDHILSAVKELGRFHGEMYALKLTDAHTFNSLKNKLFPTRYRSDIGGVQEWELWIGLGIRRATNSVRASNESRLAVPEEFLRRLQSVTYEGLAFRRKYFEPVEPIAIICHGDFLRNNLAFRYDAHGNPTDAMMFDFQTLCYTSPMLDLVSFMAVSTGWKVRCVNFHDIFTVYHEHVISHFLQKSKWSETDVPDYLKRDNVLKEYARYLPYGISIASNFLQVIHDPELPDYFETRANAIIRMAFDMGGEVMDDELRSLVTELYRLFKQCNLRLEEM